MDLSATGHQPMRTVCNRYVVIFNGEIYNYKKLREDVEKSGYRSSWRGASDTEVLLAAISNWGTVESLKRLVGMYGIAIWDCKEEKLTLARDRLGEKPVYYGWKNGVFLFGSELKALFKHPAFDFEIDDLSISQYFSHGYIPAPYSAFKGFFKLPPGHYITIDNPSNDKLSSVAYWALSDFTSGKGSQFSDELNLEMTIDELESLLSEVVSSQMQADVPVGAFLSGGVDSTLITALMQEQSSTPVHTFSIGFSEKDYDESSHARAISDYLGTVHTEFMVTPKEVIEYIPRISSVYDEPFSDVSQIPTMILSRLARQQVKVVLTGDGADELFGGYDHYSAFNTRYAMHSRIPKFLRKHLTYIIKYLPGSSSLDYMRRKELLLSLLDADNVDEVFNAQRNHWNLSADQVSSSSIRSRWVDREFERSGLKSAIDTAMFVDTLSYLPDDILVKVDRAAMSASLETRIPLLDHRIVKFAWKLPRKLKIDGNNRKYILKELLYRHVPREMVDRPKMGFSVPIGRWLKGDLREWAEGLLDPVSLKSSHYLDHEKVNKLWAEHLKGDSKFDQQLWSILVFQAWLKDLDNFR